MKDFRVLLLSFLFCIVGVGLGTPEVKAAPNGKDSIAELFKRVSPYRPMKPPEILPISDPQGENGKEFQEKKLQYPPRSNP